MRLLTNLKLDDYPVINYVEYLNPECVYIPFTNNAKLNVNSNTPIKKDTILYTNEFNEPVYSPISGQVVNTEAKKYKYNKDIITLKIINNFKEEKKKEPALKDLLTLKKENFINNLYQKGVKLHDDTDTYLYKKFQTEIKCLAIKCFDDEPMCQNSLYLFQNNMEKCLRTIDSIREIFKIENTILLVKNSNFELINQCREILSGFPKIQIKYINNYYPTNDKTLFVKQIFAINKQEDIAKIIDLTIVNILDIYNALKRKQAQTEKYITIIDGISKKSTIFKLKIGTLLKDVISEYRTINPDEVLCLNNPLKKENITEIGDYIITNNLNAICITKQATLKEKECINCGMCYRLCPKGINPLNIDFDKCLKCGLCSFYCPSNINLIKRSEVHHEK